MVNGVKRMDLANIESPPPQSKQPCSFFNLTHRQNDVEATHDVSTAYNIKVEWLILDNDEKQKQTYRNDV